MTFKYTTTSTKNILTQIQKGEKRLTTSAQSIEGSIHRRSGAQLRW